MIAVNGAIVAQGSQFSLNEVEVITAIVDLEDVRAHRSKSSRSYQAAQAERYERIEVPFALSGTGKIAEVGRGSTKPIEVRFHKAEEEIALVTTYISFVKSFAKRI